MDYNITEILNRVVNSTPAPLEETYEIEHFLPPGFTTGTPVTLKDTDDVMTVETVQRFINTVMNNFRAKDQRLDKEDWVTVLNVIVAASEASNQWTRTIKLSLILIASRLESRILLNLVNYAADSFAGQVLGDRAALPPLLHVFMRSKHIREQMKLILPTQYQANERIAMNSLPPTIILVNGITGTGLRGWVCFGNCIAINVDQYDISSHTAIMNILTLVLHESGHGLLRLVCGNFNVHTPDMQTPLHGATSAIAIVEESGREVEKAVWGGTWPQWFAPNNPRMASKLACELLTNMAVSGQFMPLTHEQQRWLTTYVGERAASNTGAADSAPMQYFD